MSFTFPKHEKLKSRKVIAQLFAEGKTVSKYPLKLYYLPQPEAHTHKAGFAVPKRSFKLAVTRNAIKRQVRETYRLHKTVALQSNESKFALLFLYIGKEKCDYTKVDSAMQAIFKKL